MTERTQAKIRVFASKVEKLERLVGLIGVALEDALAVVQTRLSEDIDEGDSNMNSSIASLCFRANGCLLGLLQELRAVSQLASTKARTLH